MQTINLLGHTLRQLKSLFGVPVIIIGILAWLTWWVPKYDPYRPLESDKAPLTIQAVAEQFKWILFILSKTLQR